MAEPSTEPSFSQVLKDAVGATSDEPKLRKVLVRISNSIKSALNASDKETDANTLYPGTKEWISSYGSTDEAKRLFIAAGFDEATVQEKDALVLKDASKSVAKSAVEDITTYLLSKRGKVKPKPSQKPVIDEDDNMLSLLQRLMARIGLGGKNSNMDLDLSENPPPTIAELAQMIASGEKKNIIVMCGAGISVASGIPDFRTPGSGLYDNLQKYNLPYPEAIFELNFFQSDPKPFFTLAKELYPGNYLPTPVHFFIRLLAEKGVLQRCYTQNIDTLERQAGISSDILVEAHGSFASAHGIGPAKKEYSQEYVKEKVFNDEIPRCSVDGSLIKPDIVFFGEGLPSRFHKLVPEDFKKCDLLIIIGTSLNVNPFASLIERVSRDTPRLLINWESVGEALPGIMGASRGFLFDRPDNYRDLRMLGDCQDRIREFVHDIGWDKEFNKLLSDNKYADMKRNDVVKAALEKKGEEASGDQNTKEEEDPKRTEVQKEEKTEDEKEKTQEEKVQNEASNQEEQKSSSSKEDEVKVPPKESKEIIAGSEEQEKNQTEQQEQQSDETSALQTDQQPQAEETTTTESESSKQDQEVEEAPKEIKDTESIQEKPTETIPDVSEEDTKTEKTTKEEEEVLKTDGN